MKKILICQVQEKVFGLVGTIEDRGHAVLLAFIMFIDKVTHKENGKWSFGKAKAQIVINKMVLLNGKV